MLGTALVYYKTSEKYDLSEYDRPTRFTVPYDFKNYYMFPAVGQVLHLKFKLQLSFQF